jgi:hydrogenase maturation protein HypF
VRTGLAAPLTTSMGRLFDAVAALCGLRTEVSYEGQAAIELEAVSDRADRGAYPLEVTRGVLDARGTIAAVALDVAAGVDASLVGARFHRAVAQATALACAEAAGARGLDTVVLAGGVWQNRLLLELTTRLLADAGLRVLVPERLPPNDGAISFGQAAVAAALSSPTR